MIPTTFLNDASGDVDLSQGFRLTPDLQTYVAQRLDENMSFFLGEWFLDQRLGIPYRQKIIGSAPDLALLDTIYRRSAYKTVGVSSVKNMKIGFDRSSRKASVAFTTVLKDGTLITEQDLRAGFFVSF